MLDKYTLKITCWLHNLWINHYLHRATHTAAWHIPCLMSCFSNSIACMTCLYWWVRTKTFPCCYGCAEDQGALRRLYATYEMKIMNNMWCADDSLHLQPYQDIEITLTSNSQWTVVWNGYDRLSLKIHKWGIQHTPYFGQEIKTFFMLTTLACIFFTLLLLIPFYHIFQLLIRAFLCVHNLHHLYQLQ